MKKMIILLGSVMMLILSMVGYAVTEPKFPDTKMIWYGGTAGDLTSEVEGTLSEISERAIREAGISGRPVKYSTKDGLIYMAFPDYGNAKRRFVRGSAWQDGILIERTKVKEIYNRDFRLPTPYVPSFR